MRLIDASKKSSAMITRSHTLPRWISRNTFLRSSLKSVTWSESQRIGRLTCSRILSMNCRWLDILPWMVSVGWKWPMSMHSPMPRLMA